MKYTSRFAAPGALAVVAFLSTQTLAQSSPSGVPDVWTRIDEVGPPPAPFRGALVENPSHGLVLLHGSPTMPLAQCAYRFNGDVWTHLITPPRTTLPPDLAKPTRFAATGDTGRSYSLIFGGVVAGQFSDKTITFDGNTFQLRADAQTSRPSPRADASLAYFAPNDALILFGGVGSNGLLSDTWSWNGEHWIQVFAEVHPSARKNHAMAFDPGHGYILLFGGTTDNGPNGETWTFDGVSWSLFSNVGPSPRALHSMFYDEGRQCVVLVGGAPQSNGADIAETWEWTGTTWSLVESEGPTPRANAVATYDSARGVGVLFGGISPQAALLNDTWELQLESPFGPGIETPAGLRPSDVTAGQFDNDPFPDAIVADSLRSSVFYFHNLGVSTGGVPRGDDNWNGFDAPDELPVDGPPGKTEAVDLNNDGKTDILVAIPSGGNGMPGSQFFLGTGSGGFTPATSLLDDFGQDDVQPGDLDNVKDLGVSFIDLVYASASQGLVGVIPGTTSGFLPPIILKTGGEPTRVALGDVNFDGLSDILWTDRVAGTVAVILQNTSGKAPFDTKDRIDFPVGLPGGEPVALVLFDFDADGDLDVATADSATNTVTALRNRGIDGGWLGFTVSDITSTGDRPVSIEAAVFFGGPLKDLATANADGDTLSILRNLDDGLFAEPINLTVTSGPVGLATADLNADGLTDLLAASAPPSPPGILTSFLANGLAPCPGDVNGDRFVGFDDLVALLERFAEFGFLLPPDFNHDNVVDFVDLNMLLANFGATCP